MGILYWRQGRADTARKLWLGLLANGGVEHDAALAALIMSQAEPAELAKLDWRKAAAWSNELLFALASRGDSRAGPILLTRLTRAEIARQMQALNKLFTPIPNDSPQL